MNAAAHLRPLAAVVVALLAGCDGLTAPDPPAEPPPVFAAIAAGGFHTCALDAAGAAYCWGSNLDRQLGRAGEEYSPWPVPVDGGRSYLALAAGGAHTCALDADGRAYCWGRGEDGRLGDGAAISRAEPVAVAGSQRFVRISAGERHTCALTHSGEAYCWGSNLQGQLGLGHTAPALEPRRVESGRVRFSRVSAGHTHTCALTPEAVAYCWGANDHAQLGNGSFEPSLAPTLVPSRIGFGAISAGSGSTCAIALDGLGYCWGANHVGQLGIGSADPLRGNPTPIAARQALARLSVGGSTHACAVAAGGAAVCWGSAEDGRLGAEVEGRTSAAPLTVQIPAAIGAISAGLHHTCALTRDGRAYCWGYGGSGQLGDGGTASHARPALVDG